MNTVVVQISLAKTVTIQKSGMSDSGVKKT